MPITSTNCSQMGSGYIPAEVSEYAGFFFSEEELQLTEILEGRIMSADEISSHLGYDASALLDRAYSREMLAKERSGDGAILYKLQPAGVVINNTAVFDPERWKAIPQNARAEIIRWHYDSYVDSKRPLSLEEKRSNGNTVMPLDNIIEYLKEKGDSFTIIPCDCHCKYEGTDCEYEKSVCICIGDELNTHRDRGLGETKSLEETIELLKYADKLGLVHSAEKDNICNCNAKYCYPTRAAFDLGTVHQWPVTEYSVEFEEDKCIGCRLCMRRCQFGVFTYEDGRIDLDVSKCWGCGLCATKCPAKALSMKYIGQTK